jgi:hypothetical protein
MCSGHGITESRQPPFSPAIIRTRRTQIENEIRVRLLVELLRNRSGAGSTQVMATTHPPVVLAWLPEAEFSTDYIFLQARREHQCIEDPILDRGSTFSRGGAQAADVGTVFRGLAGDCVVSFNVLVIPEDPTRGI